MTTHWEGKRVPPEAIATAPPGSGAGRIGEHPVLGPLPAAAAVTITFDGRPIAARQGEPLLAALLAAGVRVLRTMPTSGEARGGYCLVGRCADCLLVVDGRPNVRACLQPVRDGMHVATQIGLGPSSPVILSRGEGSLSDSGDERDEGQP